MSRGTRIKPADTGTYYHLTNRVAGMPGDYPFGDVEKAEMVELIKKLSGFFTVEILAYQIMSDHFHIVCYAPAERLSATEAAARYNRFYAGAKPALKPDDPYCETVADQMRDIGRFMSKLQQQFTAYFNRTRPGKERRLGTLWAQRFRSVILERGAALWNCVCYIEMNAVRAGLVEDPADYRFGSWGEWCATGRHPFEEALCRHLPAYEGSDAQAHSAEEIARCFRVEFARRLAVESEAPAEEEEQAVDGGESATSFTMRSDRRVRYWTDGLVIGSKSFVRETAERLFDEKKVRRHRLQPAKGPGADGLYAYRCLRTPS